MFDFLISNDKLSKEEIDIRDSITTDLEDNIEPLIIFIKLWSDDFEVNVTRKMGNSAWILTATISQRLENEEFFKKTYVIALGFKTTHHNAIHELVFTELKNLSKCTHRFYGKMKKTVPVIVRVISVSADRPERSALTGIMSHTGALTKRWMYSGSINSKKFPSCIKCFRYLIKQSIEKRFTSANRSCRSCANYDIEKDSYFTRFDMPKKYPKQQHPDSPQPPNGREIFRGDYLYCRKISFKWLISGIKFCSHNYYHQSWKKEQAKEYMRCLGVQERVAKHICDAVNNLHNQSNLYSDIMKDIKLPPSRFSNIRIEQYLDVPMHLTCEFLKQKNKKHSF